MHQISEREASVCSDLRDFDVVLRRRLTQTRQIWILGPSIGE